MSVFLNSTPQEDGNALTGGAVSVGNIPGVYFVSDFNVVTFREETQGSPQWLELTSGGQFVGIWDSFGTYLTSGDTGFSFRWKIWARGAGTVALTQDTDPGWDTSALPSPSIGNLVVSAGGWTLYHVTADPIVLADFLSFDGIRLGLSLASGAVDITTIQLECVPDGPPMGWWENQSSYDTGPFTANSAKSAANEFVTYVSAIDQGDALQNAVDDILAMNVLDYPGIDSTGSPHQIVTSAPSTARSNEDLLDPGTYAAEIFMGAGYVSVNEGGVPASPVGTEGTDYIRVPGFVTYDGTRAYTRSAANRDNIAYPVIAWDTPFIHYHVDIGATTGDYNSLGLKILVYLGNYQNPLLTTGNFLPVGVPMYEMTPADSSVVSAGISLPSDGAFTIWVVAAILRNDTVEGDEIDIANPGDDVQVEFVGDITVQSDATYVPLSPGNLTYDAHYEAFSQWDPFATPPGGKLKLRMPDDTWRILGNHADTGGRWKFESPDLTVWKEYRAVDGAVTTHPVKLYTADGWVNVVDMTPD